MITTARGHFWIKFDNGYILSVFNDFGSYSENYLNAVLRESFIHGEKVEVESKNCEVAIIYEGQLVTDTIIKCDDSVKGYVEVNELVNIINKIKNL